MKTKILALCILATLTLTACTGKENPIVVDDNSNSVNENSSQEESISSETESKESEENSSESSVSSQEGGSSTTNEPSTNGDEPEGIANVDNQTENLVLYNTVEVCHYDDGSPYVFVSRANNTDKTIIEILFGMLAFDKDGKPLELKWIFLDSSEEPSYDVIWEDSINLKPKGTAGSDEGDEDFGGWSLGWGTDDDTEQQKLFDQVTYVLCYDKQIIFENGETWNNPDYDKWLEIYKGKTVEVEELKDYYSNEDKIAK